MSAFSADPLLPAAAAARRALAARSGPALLVENLSWDELYKSVSAALSSRGISPEQASEERDSLALLAGLTASAYTAESRERLTSALYSEPRLRAQLSGLFGQPPPSAAVTAALSRAIEKAHARPDRMPEDAALWLEEPLIRPEQRLAPPDSSSSPAHRPLSAAALRVFRDGMRGSYDPIDLIFEERIGHLADLLTSVIAEASWFTGLRPSEWPSARMMAELPGQRPRPAAELYQAALAAAPVLTPLPRPDRLFHLKSVLQPILNSGSAWLEVRTLKSDWAEKHGLPTTRRLGMGTLPSSVKIVIFSAAMAAARFGPDQWKAARKRIGRRLKTHGADLAPDGRPPTLMTFRHDFIDRAKAIYPKEEVAALSGHCSADSKGHYGRPRLRGRGGRAAVLPEPDTAHVEALRAHFSRGRRSAPETAPSLSPSPGL